MYLLGITDREEVDRLWAESEERRRKVEGADGGKGRSRRRKGVRRGRPDE